MPPLDFGPSIAEKIAELTGYPFVTARNKFEAQGSLDAMVAAHASLRGLAVALMKIANDMRWLASGPRCGIGELDLPENEPGSSIMPGKVNPTQCEAIVMICIQVIGNDTAVAFAGSQGNFELNAMRPIIINNFLHSARILADGCEKFLVYSVQDTQVNEKKIDAEYLSNSLMLVTALSPVIGYDNASTIAHTAHHDGSTLREAAIKSGLIDGETFDKVVNPEQMVGVLSPESSRRPVDGMSEVSEETSGRQPQASSKGGIDARIHHGSNRANWQPYRATSYSRRGILSRVCTAGRATRLRCAIGGVQESPAISRRSPITTWQRRLQGATYSCLLLARAARTTMQ